MHELRVLLHLGRDSDRVQVVENFVRPPGFDRRRSLCTRGSSLAMARLDFAEVVYAPFSLWNVSTGERREMRVLLKWTGPFSEPTPSTIDVKMSRIGCSVCIVSRNALRDSAIASARVHSCQ